jgi:hypothetical protein
MEQLEQILLVLNIESFFIKLRSGTWFPNHLSKHLRHFLIIQITKNHQNFNQEVCKYIMKKNLPKKYFIHVLIIQSNVFRLILGQDIPFVYPTLNIFTITMFCQKFWPHFEIISHIQ